MKYLLNVGFLSFILIFSTASLTADYERNKAVPVEKVLFGVVQSVRNITEKELIEDKNKGWKTFGGALIGGAIGNQFGSGSGRDVATVLGALLGGAIASNKNPQYNEKTLRLVELMIKTEQGKEFMVVQDLDNHMLFHRQDEVRMVYLANGSVRIDKQM
jgi:outer membrane lipoprotein SlyB